MIKLTKKQAKRVRKKLEKEGWFSESYPTPISRETAMMAYPGEPISHHEAMERARSDEERFLSKDLWRTIHNIATLLRLARGEAPRESTD